MPDAGDDHGKFGTGRDTEPGARGQCLSLLGVVWTVGPIGSGITVVAVSSVVLRRALTDRGGLDLRRLPERVEVLLESLDAPPRLGAHLRAVHDVACELVDWVATNYGGVEVDRVAVLFGAATHDIGKVVHPEELSGPGSAHEQDGP